MRFTDIYPLLGSAIARRRQHLDLSQADVAERIGLTRASIANIEAGRQRVLVHHLYMIANALDCTSILDLVPSKIEEKDDLPKLVGDTEITERQMAQVLNLFQNARTTAKNR